MKRAPECRFKGFKKNWENTVLLDETYRVNRKNEGLDSNRVLTISAQYGLIDQNDFFNKRIASYLLQGY